MDHCDDHRDHDDDTATIADPMSLRVWSCWDLRHFQRFDRITSKVGLRLVWRDLENQSPRG